MTQRQSIRENEKLCLYDNLWHFEDIFYFWKAMIEDIDSNKQNKEVCH